MLEGSQPTPAESTPAPSLRDTLTAAYDTVEKTVATTTPVAPETAEPARPAPASSPAAASPGATPADGPARGPDGKFVAKDKELEPAPVAEPPLQRPSSWKKDYWGHWEKLTKGEPLTREEAIALAKYQHERENDFVKGVSTYKQEWDRAKPVLEALHPYRDLIASAKATPEQFVTMAAETHRILSNGTPQDKLREIARFATAYGVPLHELFVQGEDGKLYANQTYFQPQQTPAQAQGLPPEEIDKRVEQKLAQWQLTQQIQQFQAAKDPSGNPLYPHYEAVWKTMGGILRAGLAQDLPTAYKVALSLPQHADLAPQTAAQPPAPDEAEKKRIAAEAAQKAKAKAVSPRNQAPTNVIPAGNGKRDGLRAQLESAFDQHLGSGGRV